jgi:hypothetical protein
MGCLRFLLSPFGCLFGFIAMAVVAFAGFAITLSALGAPACYRDDSWMVGDTFAAILLGIHFVATIVGGAVARRTGGGFAVFLLLAVALLTSLVPHLDSPLDASKSQRFTGRPESRGSDAALADLTKWTEQPDWMRYAGALVGVTGVLFGSSLAAPRGAAPARARRQAE